MRGIGWIGAPLAFLGWLGLLGQAGFAAEPTAARAGLHPGFGRLVLDWSAPVTVDAEPRGEWVRLSFPDPFEEDLSPILGELEDYLLGFAPGATRKDVMLLLAPGVSPNVFTFDRHVVIDFYRVPGEHPVLPVRTGRHDGIARIVFDWPELVVFRLSQRPGRVVLEFDRSVRIDAQAIVGGLAPTVVDAWVESDGRRSRLLVRVPRDRIASAYRQPEDRRRVLLDLEPAPRRLPPLPEPAPPKNATATPQTS